MEKIYRVQMNSKGMPNFATAEEVADRPQVNAELRADFLKRQYESALEEIKRLKADRPQGEWFVYDDDDYLYTDIKCSACRTGFTVDSYKRDDIGFTIEDLKFCPNCGARMKGADDA